MVPQPRARLSAAEYLAADRAATEKCEFIAGEVFAMAGASENHNLIVTNVVAEIRSQLKGRPCKVYPSDLRVRISESGAYLYPDVTIACGKAELAHEQRDILLNPTVIIEVLSSATEAYDRGEKFAHYRKLPSLQEYLLIAQDSIGLEHYVRQDAGRWLLSEARLLEDTVEIVSVNCTLKLAEVYDKVEFVRSSASGASEPPR